MEENLTQVVNNFQGEWVSILLGVGVGVLYAWFCLSVKAKRPNFQIERIFRTLGWFNTIVGVLIQGPMCLSFGLTLLFFKFIILPIKLKPEEK